MDYSTKIKSRINLLFAGLLALAIACDSLEPDTLPTESPVEITQEPLIINPHTSGMIDLKTLIKSSGNYRFSTSQPRLGNLESMGNDLLRYTTKVAAGRDGFRLSIFDSNNNKLNEDSVIIIITPDTTNLPCGLWAFTDEISNVDSVVTFDVLGNDIICGVDSSLIQITVPNNLEIAGIPVPPSYFGTVEVLSGGRIRYTAGPNYPGEDKFVYKITKPANVPSAGDPELTAYGFVYLKATQNPDPGDTTAHCAAFGATDDIFTFSADSVAAGDSLYLDVLANDITCNGNVELSIKEVSEGTLWVLPGQGFLYVFPQHAQAGFEDRFRYVLCSNAMCDEAEVKVIKE